MNSSRQIEVPPSVGLVALAILSLSLWALSFSHSCSSDGCIGIFVPAGAAAVTLAIQLLAVIPYEAVKRKRAGLTLWPAIAVWIAGSFLALAIPLAFVK
jgi:hypothetical protein